MKNITALKIIIVAGQPAGPARSLLRTDTRLARASIRSHHTSSRKLPFQTRGKKLKLLKFQNHRFTPKIQVLQEEPSGRCGAVVSSEWRRLGQMFQVIHRVQPASRGSIQTLAEDLC